MTVVAYSCCSSNFIAIGNLFFHPCHIFLPSLVPSIPYFLSYVGPSCLMCGESFYGDLTGCRPDQVGISNSSCSCHPCRCNGNVDSNAIGNCDGKSGACLKCTYGTTGRYCERCLPGYFGVAVIPSRHSNCARCDCDPRGTKPTEINGAPEMDCGEDGQCRCIDHVGGRRCDQPKEGFRWWRKGENVEGLNSKTPFKTRPQGPSLLPPGVVIEPPSSGFIGIPRGEEDYEIVDPITGRVIPIPRRGAMIIKIPPGGHGYRVIDGISRKEIDIPLGGSSWVVDPTSGRVLGIPSRVMSGTGKHGLVDPDGSPLPLAPAVLPPGILVRPPAGGYIGVPIKGSEYKIIDPVTGKLMPIPENEDGFMVILIPPGGGGYRLIDPVTSREVEVPSGGGYYVVDSASERVIGIPASPDGKEALVDPDRITLLPGKPHPDGEMIMIPGHPTWLPGTRFRPVIPCICDAVGSLGLACSDDGQCLCKPGVEGLKCGKCAKGFYDLKADGCRPCNCDPVGSLSSACDESGR